ncbi:MAG: DsbA family protein [Methanobrevibacter sp.]|nr:DsbA family protein [Methanobrevibacter sp.]
MKIIYWSDFNCPYSYMGYVQLKKAIRELKLDIELEMKAFEIEPNLDDEITPMINYYAGKYGIPESEAKSRLEEIDDIAKEEGLNIEYSNAKVTSSKDAHRLVKLAMSRNIPSLADSIIEKTYNAFLCENKPLAEKEVLIEIGTSQGLGKDEITEMLDSNRYEVEVQLDEEDAILNGVEAVPCYFIKNGSETLVIPGALSKEGFKNSLKDLKSGDIESKTFL